MSGPSVVPKGEGWIAKELQSIRRDMREQLASQANAFNTTVATLNQTVQLLPTVSGAVQSFDFWAPPVNIPDDTIAGQVPFTTDISKPWANITVTASGGWYESSSSYSGLFIWLNLGQTTAGEIAGVQCLWQKISGALRFTGSLSARVPLQLHPDQMQTLVASVQIGSPVVASIPSSDLRIGVTCISSS